jgi:zinc transport system ATP-binding protein
MPSPAIIIDNVSFSYQNTPVLENVSISIYEGDFVAVFGPNGGGKTTLLQLIMGLLQPQQGTISLWGKTP